MPETPASNPGPSLPEPPRPPAPPKPPASASPSPPKPPASPSPSPPQGFGPRNEERERITDPERMKALAHPARIAVFDFLGARRIQGFDGATATEIAEMTGMTPSAMSYHLRTLAKAGFIEEAPSRGDARERVWRLKVYSFSIQAEKDAPESHNVVEQALVRAFADQEERTFRRASEVLHRLDPEIRDIATTSHGRLRLKPEELSEFRDRFFKLLNEYVDRSSAYIEGADSEDDGTVVMHYLFRLFPHVEF